MACFTCRAPGRINIIGEHTDYVGLPVLPMTIHQDIRVACTPRSDNTIRLHNTDPAFPDVTFPNTPDLPPSPIGAWENYCKAAIAGLNPYFRSNPLPGMDLAISGTIPVAAGLSSSSALVVACALAYLRLLGQQLDKDISRLALATFMADAEQYTGTRGGGMDQAIILLGEEGHALKIDFFPLRTEPVPMLQGYSFIVSNSLIKAEKTGAALHRYNAGPKLAQLITALAEHQAKQEFGDEIELKHLGDLWNGYLCLTHGEVAKLFEKTFSKDHFPLTEITTILNMTPENIRKSWLADLPEPPKGFNLKARARHYLTEYQRVEIARDALLANDPNLLADCMNASHESCTNDYEISCPEVNTLVAIARESGALGARLTGAGFGGCTINLVPTSQCDSFLENIRHRYYGDYLKIPPSHIPSKAIFVAESAPPAGYL